GNLVEVAVAAGDIVGMDRLATLNGSSLPVDAGHGDVKIGGAKVLATDITASNGVIHVIDTVLVP
ncbi:MAG: fasciclin domain-containing protein, partial [Gemmatimonadetes bacterium]|nr:fasciclin domain-containing protein [Gemmatimonadota bacterium]